MFNSLESLIATLIISVAAGFIANMAMGDGKNSLVANLVLGFFGSWLGSIIASVLHVYFWGFFSSLLFATMGAMLLIWLGRKFLNNSTSGTRL